MSNDSFNPPHPQDRRPVPGYENTHEIDREGNVYAIHAYQGLKAGRRLKVYSDVSGYARVVLCTQGRSENRNVHRLLMLAWSPVENSAELDVNHIDGNKKNNSLSNLEWTTHLENMRHADKVLNAWEHRSCGRELPQAKLSEADVREVRRLWAGGKGMKQKDLAALYGMSQEGISAIVRRKSWKHIVP